MIKPPRTFSLIGPGRVGSSLGMALEKKEWTCKSVMRRGSSKSQLARLKSTFPNAIILTNQFVIRGDFEVLFICVRDGEIENVVARLSSINKIDWNSKVVFHVSGIKGVELLDPLKKLGAAIGALHPVAAFANEFQPESAFGIYFDYLGDNSGLIIAKQIVKLFNSKLIVLENELQKVILHVASAIASNSTVVAVRSAEKLISDFVKPADAKIVMASLMSSTVNNLLNNDGMKSLTGPLVRGDVEVISRHIKALESNKTLLQFYKSWSLLGVETLLKAGHKNKVRLKEINKILSR